MNTTKFWSVFFFSLPSYRSYRFSSIDFDADKKRYYFVSLVGNIKQNIYYFFF
eukprot:NODE_4050_length_334_cov_34.424561_g3968_i0.p1 GENE.NODE_4050_length_334_cov_34.424561_g3968_i0~~NODE_4050_length_334_cov_34.424561_g3968_i0.p1  ORF type:complete len:53 (+),score=3.90 NODE_4050_length_334_cov_34.424561_g3968_i0:105-263(+)